jgi:hypothetical protein
MRIDPMWTRADSNRFAAHAFLPSDAVLLRAGMPAS